MSLCSRHPGTLGIPPFWTVSVPQEVVCQAAGYNVEEYLSLNTEQQDSSKLIDVLWLFLLWSPHPFCIPPLMSYLIQIPFRIPQSLSNLVRYPSPWSELAPTFLTTSWTSFQLGSIPSNSRVAAAGFFNDLQWPSPGFITEGFSEMMVDLSFGACELAAALLPLQLFCEPN